MIKTKGKIISFILALVMIFGALPYGFVYANGDDTIDNDDNMVSLSDYIEEESKLEHIYIQEGIKFVDKYKSFLKKEGYNVKEEDLFEYKIDFSKFKEFISEISSLSFFDKGLVDNILFNFKNNFNSDGRQLNNEYEQAFNELDVLGMYSQKSKNKIKLTEKEAELVELATNISELNILEYDSSKMPDLSNHKSITWVIVVKSNEAEEIGFDLTNLDISFPYLLRTYNIGKYDGYKNYYGSNPSFGFHRDEIEIKVNTDKDSVDFILSDKGSSDYFYNLVSVDKDLTITDSENTVKNKEKEDSIKVENDNLNLKIKNLKLGKNEIKLELFKSNQENAFRKDELIDETLPHYLEHYDIDLLVTVVDKSNLKDIIKKAEDKSKELDKSEDDGDAIINSELGEAIEKAKLIKKKEDASQEEVDKTAKYLKEILEKIVKDKEQSELVDSEKEKIIKDKLDDLKDLGLEDLEERESILEEIDSIVGGMNREPKDELKEGISSEKDRLSKDKDQLTLVDSEKEKIIKDKLDDLKDLGLEDLEERESILEEIDSIVGGMNREPKDELKEGISSEKDRLSKDKDQLTLVDSEKEKIIKDKLDGLKDLGLEDLEERESILEEIDRIVDEMNREPNDELKEGISYEKDRLSKDKLASENEDKDKEDNNIIIPEKEKEDVENKPEENYSIRVDDVKEGNVKITGKGDPGIELIVKDEKGVQIGRGKVNKDGNFVIEIDKKLKEKDILKLIPLVDGEEKEYIDIVVKEKDREIIKGSHLAYIEGYEDGTVRPTSKISRQEVAAVLYRLLPEEKRLAYSTLNHNFTDVEANLWSREYIATLANLGVIEGNKGKFRPYDEITRAELVAMIARINKLVKETDNKKSKLINSFSDIKGHWGEEYITFAAKKGWVEGYEDGSFRPNKDINRAELITIVNNFLGRKIKKSNIPKNIKKFIDLEEHKWYYEAIVEASNNHYYEKDEDGYEIWTEIYKLR